MYLLKLFLVLTLPCIPILLYKETGIGRWFFHDILKWHIPKEKHKAGYYTSSKCMICEKPLIKDSHGNWL